MKFSIVTPCYNRTDFLDDTIHSVLSQKGNFEIEYIIQDGSTNKDVYNVFLKWKEKLSNGFFEGYCNNVDFKYYHEKDEGMYDAISRGFSKITGDVMAWLNSDDMYYHFAFQTLNQVFSEFERLKWLTGLPTLYNSRGGNFWISYEMPAFSQELMKKGFYHAMNKKYEVGWLQQESTFWRKEVYENSSIEKLKDFKFAGDFFLWTEFAKKYELVKIRSILSGIRKHKGQLSTNLNAYKDEITLSEKPSLEFKILFRLFKLFPKLKLNVTKFNWLFKGLRYIGINLDKYVGPSIEWAFDNKREWYYKGKRIIF